jgi:hypothetical protein
MLIMAALMRISDTESKLIQAESKLKRYTKHNKLGFLGKLKYVLFGNTP